MIKDENGNDCVISIAHIVTVLRMPEPHTGCSLMLALGVDALTPDKKIARAPLEVVTQMTVAEVAAEIVAARAGFATAPPVAAAVEVAPTDLERAADVMVLLADAARDGGWRHLGDDEIDDALQITSYEWGDTADALIILADRLRGGG
jgi:hypothetical protein